VLRVRNLQIAIAGKVLIKDLSFELPEPAFVAIIGHNGSGKTSLFKAFLNLLPYRGEIFLSSTPAFLQQKNTIHFDIPAKELAVMGKFREKKLFDPYNQEDFKEALSIFNTLGIQDLFNKNVQELSGGEQQLVWFAQAIMQDREILLLDEPTQYLDVRNKKILFDYMKQLVHLENKTIVCITHDLLNLYSMKGFFLNLSAPTPSLLPISKEAIDQHQAILEESNGQGSVTI
jgi:iron complex transport system ATP-binding protein